MRPAILRSTGPQAPRTTHTVPAPKSLPRCLREYPAPPTLPIKNCGVRRIGRLLSQWTAFTNLLSASLTPPTMPAQFLATPGGDALLSGAFSPTQLGHNRANDFGRDLPVRLLRIVGVPHKTLGLVTPCNCSTVLRLHGLFGAIAKLP